MDGWMEDEIKKFKENVTKAVVLLVYSPAVCTTGFGEVMSKPPVFSGQIQALAMGASCRAMASGVKDGDYSRGSPLGGVG